MIESCRKTQLFVGPYPKKMNSMKCILQKYKLDFCIETCVRLRMPPPPLPAQK
jgi:hypothetical protein